MTLEQPGLGSDSPKGSGRERGATNMVVILSRQFILWAFIEVHKICLEFQPNILFDYKYKEIGHKMRDR